MHSAREAIHNYFRLELPIKFNRDSQRHIKFSKLGGGMAVCLESVSGK